MEPFSYVRVELSIHLKLKKYAKTAFKTKQRATHSNRGLNALFRSSESEHPATQLSYHITGPPHSCPARQPSRHKAVPQHNRPATQLSHHIAGRYTAVPPDSHPATKLSHHITGLLHSCPARQLSRHKAVYLVACSFSWSLDSLLLFRFMTSKRLPVSTLPNRRRAESSPVSDSPKRCRSGQPNTSPGAGG